MLWPSGLSTLVGELVRGTRDKLSYKFLPGQRRILQNRCTTVVLRYVPSSEIFVVRGFQSEVFLYVVGWHSL